MRILRRSFSRPEFDSVEESAEPRHASNLPRSATFLCESLCYTLGTVGDGYAIRPVETNDRARILLSQARREATAWSSRSETHRHRRSIACGKIHVGTNSCQASACASRVRLRGQSLSRRILQRPTGIRVTRANVFPDRAAKAFARSARCRFAGTVALRFPDGKRSHLRKPEFG